VQLPKAGRPRDEILADLAQLREGDVDWRSGRTFSYVFSGGEDVHDIAREAASMYLSENALNPMAFPSLGQMQADVVDMMSDLLNGGAEAAGFMTSGGTESILCAVKAARERGREERGIDRPQMVLADSAHAAFHKAAHYFGVEVAKIPVRDDWRADVDAMAAAVTDRTVLVVGSAPQYPQGVVDPIPELAAIAADAGANFHTDACMGGLVLPFMEAVGHEVPPWDFRVPGVTSISADLHKLGYTPKGASVIVHRTDALRKYQIFVFDQWLGGFYASSGMMGTKPGAPIAAAWAVLNYLGEDGYVQRTEQTIATARTIMAGVRALPDLALRGEPDAHVLSFGAAEPEQLDVFAVGDALQERKWFLDRQTPPDSLHATVSAGNAPMVDDFLTDLQAAVAQVGARQVDDRSTNYATLE